MYAVLAQIASWLEPRSTMNSRSTTLQRKARSLWHAPNMRQNKTQGYSAHSCWSKRLQITKTTAMCRGATNLCTWASLELPSTLSHRRSPTVSERSSFDRRRKVAL